MKEINLFQLNAFETAVSGHTDSESQRIAEAAKRHKEAELCLKAKRIIEALLFAACEPVPFQKIAEIVETLFPYKPKAIKELLEDLKVEYITEQRSFRLEETATGYVLRTNEEYGPYIEMLFRSKRGEKLSQAAAEVLAIIAYKQPITRPQIDALRGVDSSGIIQNLVDRQLIEPTGKLEAPGRPTVYSITQHFLTHFGLRSLSELPSLNQLMV